VFRDQVLRAEPEQWDVVYARVNGSLPLDEAVSKSGSKVVYLQGELDLSASGAVKVQLDSGEAAQVWIDELPVPLSPGAASSDVSLESTGRHAITLRVDTATRHSPTIRVEVIKPAGSKAEFTIVGGR